MALKSLQSGYDPLKMNKNILKKWCFTFTALLSCAIFLLFQNFEIRITAILFLVWFGINSVKDISKKTVFLSLLFFYCLAYIFSPYCYSFPFFYNIISTILLLGLGVFWAWQASSTVHINFKFFHSKILIFLTVLIYFVNARALHADIKWMGDEDYHISATIELFKYVFLNLSGKGPLNIDAVHIYTLRYPLVEKWFGILFLAPNAYKDIALYRAIPFLSIIFLSWFLFQQFLKRDKNNNAISFFLAFSFVTTPLIIFYSSLLYLELPVMLLMTFCLFDLNQLLTLKLNKLLTRPSWYALLLISFLKEPVFIFLVTLLSLRFIHQVQEISLLKLKGWWKLFLSEIKIWFLILLPIYIYLFFRLFFFHYRSYPGQFYNLFNPSYYAILASALFNQLGFFFIFGLLGFLFIFKKEKHLFGPLLLLLLGMTFFFMCDHAMYIGYSRWNLFLFPFFIFSSTKLISSLKKTYQVAAIILILTSNFFLCPIHLDGSRLPSWGLPLTDGSGCIYPYEKAIRYLKEEQNTKHLVVFGQYHSYAGFNFYFNKYDFHPQMEVFLYPEKLNKREEELSFQNFFRDYNNTADTILYHSINNINLDENLLYGRTFKIVQRIRNLEHSIYILKRTIP